VENEGERVYGQQDNKLRWCAFAQQSVSTLANSQNRMLRQMVVDVGGDPDNFGSRGERAAFIIQRERPLSVVREEDESEMLGGSFRSGVASTAAGNNFWGVGQWQGGEGGEAVR
jgi:hypothetical protein